MVAEARRQGNVFLAILARFTYNLLDNRTERSV
jgi:hypothetical protein